MALLVLCDLKYFYSETSVILIGHASRYDPMPANTDTLDIPAHNEAAPPLVERAVAASNGHWISAG